MDYLNLNKVGCSMYLDYENYPEKHKVAKWWFLYQLWMHYNIDILVKYVIKILKYVFLKNIDDRCMDCMYIAF